MKLFLTAFVFLFSVFSGTSQTSYEDSLSGFDAFGARRLVQSRNYAGEDSKCFLKLLERNYIRSKFGSDLGKNRNEIKGYSQSNINSSNPPCMNIDFENLPTGTISATSGWTVSYADSPSSYPPCWLSGITYTLNSAMVLVASTPITDANCNNVAPSPLGGNNVVVINKNNTSGPLFNPNPTKLAQNFSVTASNYIFRYAYKASLNSFGHPCCGAPAVLFNFYDCSNTLISALSKTVSGLSYSLCPAWDTTGFIMVQTFTPAYTPNWVITTINLSQYIGSCITVEVVASNCSASGHQGYCYYDADCSGSMIKANNDSLIVSTYTSCVKTATLSAVGFSNYVWQGPATSGVNGSTLSTVTTSVAGIYTLTANNWIFASTQTLNLSFSNLASGLTIMGSTLSTCAGGSVALQANGNGINTYTWNTGANTSSIIISPTLTSQYSVLTTNTFGCVESGSALITVYAYPQIQMVASSNSICIGQPANLMVLGNNIGTILWNTGATTQSVSFMPTLSTVYSVSVTSANGCTTLDSKTITVLALPQVSITVSSQTLCLGQSAALSVNGTGLLSYLWNSGQPGQSIQVVPLSTSYYTVMVTDNYGCSSSATASVEVVVCSNTLTTGLGKNFLSAAEISVFPNPSSGSFLIRAAAPLKGDLIDELGQVILKFELTEETNLSYAVARLANGLYFVRGGALPIKVIVK